MLDYLWMEKPVSGNPLLPHAGALSGAGLSSEEMGEILYGKNSMLCKGQRIVFVETWAW